MACVRVHRLVKEYSSVVRGEGLKESIRSLFRPVKKVHRAVDEVSFSIEQGESVAFLGPNGAGKTTTLKMLSGILYPSSGEISVLGYTPFQRKSGFLRQIALVMGNRQQLWWDLPARDSYAVLRDIYGVDQVDFEKRLSELVELLNLGDKLTVQLRRLSLGERMKCELIAALLHHPRVVFLDEPTLGLDVTSQQNIRTFLRQHQAQTGCTILLTTHYMQDVESICDRVMIINHGKIISDGPLKSLAEKYGQEKRLRLSFSHPVTKEALSAFGSVREQDGLTALLALPKASDAGTIARVLSELPVHDLTIEEPSVEEIISDMFQRPPDHVSRETS